MNTITDNLERYYNGFINQQNDWAFFLGLADYIKYAIGVPEIKKIIENFNQKKNSAENELKKYEKIAIKEIEEVKNRLMKEIKSKKINIEDHKNLLKIIENWEKYQNGEIWASGSNVSYLSEILISIMRYLQEGNYKELVKSFLEAEKDGRIKKYICFKKVYSYYEVEEKYKEKRNIEFWGLWEDLFLAYIVIFEKEKQLKELEKDNKKNYWRIINFKQIVGEMERIKGNSIFSDSMPILFVKNAYISSATRIHIFLVKELSQKEKKEEKEIGNKKIKIVIDFQKGIYKKNDIEKIYEISGKRFKIVKQLLKRKTNTPLSELVANTGQYDGVIIKEIGNINKVFKKRLKLKEDLIVNLITGGGYRLNDEYFIIEGKKTFT